MENSSIKVAKYLKPKDVTKPKYLNEW